MAGRRWTEEELVTLEEMIDTHTVEVIARRLDRSFDSVNIKLNRMGLSGFAKSTDLLTMNQVCLMMGVESRTVKKKWCSKGLHFMRKGNYLVVKQQALLKYLEQHPEDWNAADVTEDSMLLAYPWYREKRKADTKSGTSSGTMALAREIRFPLSKSAPRAIWAFMILSASSISVGMKRSAMDIIIASSWAGKWIFFSGLRSISMPSDSAMGEVVRVIREVPSTRKTNRRE